MDTKFFGTGLSNRLGIHNVTTQDTKYLNHRGNFWRLQDTVGWMLTIKQADGQSLPPYSSHSQQAPLLPLQPKSDGPSFIRNRVGYSITRIDNLK